MQKNSQAISTAGKILTYKCILVYIESLNII